MLRPGQAGVIEGKPRQALRRSLYRRVADGRGELVMACLAKKKHRADRLPGQWRCRPAPEKGHAGGDGISGPRAAISNFSSPALGIIGKPFFIGEKPGSAQTHEARQQFPLGDRRWWRTSEAVVMGVKSGLDPAVMIDVINRRLGHEHRKPRQVSSRRAAAQFLISVFATGLMVKDVRLALDEMKIAGVIDGKSPKRFGRLWETVIRDMGPESDFYEAIKPIERAAGVIVGGAKGGSHAAKSEVAVSPGRLRSAKRCAADPGVQLAWLRMGPGSADQCLHAAPRPGHEHSQPRRLAVHRDQFVDFDGAGAPRRIGRPLTSHFLAPRRGCFVKARLHPRRRRRRSWIARRVAGLRLGEIAVRARCNRRSHTPGRPRRR